MPGDVGSLGRERAAEHFKGRPIFKISYPLLKTFGDTSMFELPRNQPSISIECYIGGRYSNRNQFSQLKRRKSIDEINKTSKVFVAVQKAIHLQVEKLHLENHI